MVHTHKQTRTRSADRRRKGAGTGSAPRFSCWKRMGRREEERRGREGDRGEKEVRPARRPRLGVGAPAFGAGEDGRAAGTGECRLSTCARRARGVFTRLKPRTASRGALGGSPLVRHAGSVCVSARSIGMHHRQVTMTLKPRPRKAPLPSGGRGPDKTALCFVACFEGGERARGRPPSFLVPVKNQC